MACGSKECKDKEKDGPAKKASKTCLVGSYAGTKHGKPTCYKCSSDECKCAEGAKSC